MTRDAVTVIRTLAHSDVQDVPLVQVVQHVLEDAESFFKRPFVTCKTYMQCALRSSVICTFYTIDPTHREPNTTGMEPAREK